VDATVDLKKEIEKERKREKEKKRKRKKEDRKTEATVYAFPLYIYRIVMIL
jgi:hypothetical protein